MNTQPSIADDVNAQLGDAPLRILIIGAGISGATLAALCRQRGQAVSVIERRDANEPAGYMLGMMPLGGRVLNGLGVHDAYLASSQEMRWYEMHGRSGQSIARYALNEIANKYGSYQGIDRGTLLNMLRELTGKIRYEATVTALTDGDDGVEVTFSDASKILLDLVVIADGLNSRTRNLVLSETDLGTFSTGWGGFVTWSNTAVEPHTYRELWSNGWGIGLYPVKDRVGLFLAGREKDISERDGAEYIAELRKHTLPEQFAAAIDGIDPDAGMTYWPMTDHRADVWHTARTVLLGDAAAGFLPTAGVGASMAMDSAAALADELSRASADHIEYAVRLYERRQRHRVELAQNNSRQLARFMFINHTATAVARDQAAHFYSADRALADISRVMEGR